MTLQLETQRYLPDQDQVECFCTPLPQRVPLTNLELMHIVQAANDVDESLLSRYFPVTVLPHIVSAQRQKRLVEMMSDLMNETPAPMTDQQRRRQKILDRFRNKHKK